MISVKLNNSGYTKVYENKNISTIGGYEDDSEVQEWLAINGNTVEPEFTEAELLKQSETATALEIKVALEALVITHNTVAYDANGKAIGNMGAVVGLANWKFNKALMLGSDIATAYQTIYKDTRIYWKGADNKSHGVMIESICEALDKSMNAIASTLGL